MHHLYKSKHIKPSYWSGGCACRNRSMNAAIYMGPDFLRIWKNYNNTNFDELQNFFDITKNLILYKQSEILNMSIIECTSPSWTRSTLSQNQVIQWTNAKVRVYSDSVLLLVKMSFHNEAITRWSSGRNLNGRSKISWGDAAVSGSEHAKWHSGTVVILKLAFHLDPSRARSGIDFEGSQLSEKRTIEYPSVINLEITKLTKNQQISYLLALMASKNTDFQELQNLFDLTQKNDIGPSSWDPECDNDWLDSSLMGEIYTYSRSNDQLDESKRYVYSNSVLC